MTEIYRDKTKTAEERAGDLLSRMTLQEKAAQMLQLPYAHITREEALGWAEKGLGSFFYVLGDDARELQATALKTRLGIPVLFGIDAIHGHAVNESATVFPTQLGMACSWDRGLVEEMGRVTAREVAADGLHWTFSPVLCLARDARWGRVGETFGEDPYLAGELGAAIIKGYQGGDISGGESILACAKHYLGYGEAVGARDACDTEATFRKVREVFLPPFEKAVKAGCATIMTAYGSIDGTPLTASEKALRQILKEELGFDGFVVTDWDNVGRLITYQHAAADMSEASSLAVKAGNDMIMTTAGFYEAAIKLVEDKKLDEKLLDEAVLRILLVKFEMGLFEQPEDRGNPACIRCAGHLELNKKIARESIVLLKNSGVLPLNKSTKLAVLGPNADNIRAQYGDWTYLTHPEPEKAKNRQPKRPYFTVLEGLRELGAAIVEQPGDADVILYVTGDTAELHGETKDRANLELPREEQELFADLLKLNKPVVTVLVSSKPLCAAEMAEGSGAFIAAFNGGMFGGLAVAEALLGDINPCGKLPVSFPRHSGQVPVYYNSLPGWHEGKYVDLPETPLFTFGEGLSYTRYGYSNLKFSEDSLALSVDVTNSGSRDGRETVQVYFNDKFSSVITPVMQLIAFEKIDLKAGETKTVEFKLSKSDFSLVTPDERRVAEPGAFVLMAGPCAKEECLLKTEFVL